MHHCYLCKQRNGHYLSRLCTYILFISGKSHACEVFIDKFKISSQKEAATEMNVILTYLIWFVRR